MFVLAYSCFFLNVRTYVQEFIRTYVQSHGSNVGIKISKRRIYSTDGTYNVLIGDSRARRGHFTQLFSPYLDHEVASNQANINNSLSCKLLTEREDDKAICFPPLAQRCMTDNLFHKPSIKKRIRLRKAPIRCRA